MKNLKDQIGLFLYRGGVPANVVTFLGLLSAFISGLLIFQGRFFWAGWFLLLSGGLDLLDGAVARAAGVKNPFGGILDSSFDRYGDGFLFGGIIFYCATRGAWLYTALAFSALLGSFLISYVRARAECAVEKCKVGFWERGERLVYVALGLFLDNLALALWVLAIGTHVTALFRLYYSGHTGRERKWAIEMFFQESGRQSPFYLWKVGVLGLLVLLLRLPLA